MTLNREEAKKEKQTENLTKSRPSELYGNEAFF